MFWFKRQISRIIIALHTLIIDMRLSIRPRSKRVGWGAVWRWLSHPEGDLEVLPSPDVHAVVVRPHVREVGPADGEQSTGDRRGSGEGTYYIGECIHNLYLNYQ